MNFKQQLDQLYRDYAPRLLGALVAHLHQWDEAEEAMAEAFAKAATLWPVQAWPENPQAWLYRVAVHAAYDRQKQINTQNKYSPDLLAWMEAADNDSDFLAPDQRLNMFFLCAHPSLSTDTQALLILRYCALLPTEVIARAFLLEQEAVSKRLQRAKFKLQEAGIQYELPDAAQWPERLPPVLAAIEVLYDQSYADIAGGVEIESLARDALQLAQTLTDLLPNEPEVMGLLAIMLFCESRRFARQDSQGLMIPLNQQDVELWNMQYIARAAEILQKATSMRTPGPMQIRAAIHAAHARKKQIGHTPWDDIISLYQVLLDFDDSALIQINLAVAYAQHDQIEQAQYLLNSMDKNQLKYLPAYHLAVANVSARQLHYAEAIVSIKHALTLSNGQAERKYLQKQLIEWRSKI